MTDPRYEYEESSPGKKDKDDFSEFLKEFLPRQDTRKASPPVEQGAPIGQREPAPGQKMPLPSDRSIPDSHGDKTSANQEQKTNQVGFQLPQGEKSLTGRVPIQKIAQSVAFPVRESSRYEMEKSHARDDFPAGDESVEKVEDSASNAPPTSEMEKQYGPKAPEPGEQADSTQQDAQGAFSFREITIRKIDKMAKSPSLKVQFGLPTYNSEEISKERVSIETRSKVSLYSLFSKMIGYCASDLHLTSGASPVFRVDGDIVVSNLPMLNNADLEEMLFPLLSEEQFLRFDETGELDFAIEVTSLARFRINYYRQHRGMSAVFRLIPLCPMEFGSLGLPPVVKTIAESKKGLVIVTGPTGSGKTTTLAAMVHHMNRTRDDHIITIEDPLEFIHRSNRCLITHREVGNHANSFAEALRAAIREDPDVILVGEMRDVETMDLAIKASEMGFLVLTTLHTTNAASSIDRILDSFPIKQQEQIRLVLSQSLRAVIAQQLIKKKDLNGRIPAVEVLIASKALSSLVKEGKTHQIPSIIQTGADIGMLTMDQAFIELIKKDIIRKETIKHRISDFRLFERAGIYFR